MESTETTIKRLIRSEDDLDQARTVVLGAPSLRLMNVLLSGYCRHGKMEDAVALVDMMKGDQKADRTSYHLLITGFGRQGNVRAAERTLQHMQKAGILPNERTYVLMIELYADAGKMDRAQFVVDQMRAKGFTQVPPDALLALANGFEKAGNYDAAAKLHEQLDEYMNAAMREMSAGLEDLENDLGVEFGQEAAELQEEFRKVRAMHDVIRESMSSHISTLSSAAETNTTVPDGALDHEMASAFTRHSARLPQGGTLDSDAPDVDTTFDDLLDDTDRK